MSMKTRFKCACVVGLVYGALVFVNAAEFHVSPTGSNLNPGTADQPFQTIERARDAIRVLKSKSGLPDGGVEVVIHGGEYRLTQTVELTPQDSGEKDRPIRYRAAIPTCWIELELREGRNRQVRRMTAAAGFPTLRLIRHAIGEWTCEGLAPGEWREINPFKGFFPYKGLFP